MLTSSPGSESCVCVCACVQRESNREPSATEKRAQFAGFGVNAQGHGLRPVPFQSHLERLSIPVSESLSESVSDAPSPAAHKQVSSCLCSVICRLVVTAQASGAVVQADSVLFAA